MLGFIYFSLLEDNVTQYFKYIFLRGFDQILPESSRTSLFFEEVKLQCAMSHIAVLNLTRVTFAQLLLITYVSCVFLCCWTGSEGHPTWKTCHTNWNCSLGKCYWLCAMISTSSPTTTFLAFRTGCWFPMGTRLLRLSHSWNTLSHWGRRCTNKHLYIGCLTCQKKNPI